MPERVDFWGIPHGTIAPDILVYVVMAAASIVLAYRLYLRARLWWRVGRPERRWDRPLERVLRLIRYGVLQTRVLGQRFPGLMHAGLAWGFFAFFVGTALATIDSHVVKFLRGDVFLAYKLLLDGFTVLFLIGAAMAAWRRYVQRPARLTSARGFGISLALATFVVIGGLTVESLRLAAERPEWAWASPAGSAVARIWAATGATDETLTSWHHGAWSIHLLSVAVLMVVVPGGTLLHMISGPLNIFFSKLDRPTGRLAPLRTGDDGKPVFVSSLGDLGWKQLLDADACTECGRCQDACPSHGSGAALNPKALVLALREALRADGPSIARAASASSARGRAASGGNGAGAAEPYTGRPLVGDVVSEAELWACTTCGACVCECPVMVEHVDTVVDLRRRLVVDGRMDAQLQSALDNLGRYGNSFGKSPRMRAKWTAGIEPKIPDARTQAVEYLWFVGDYASFSPSLTDITRKTAEVFRAAGLDFGILYEAEQNAGNDVRRVGEEGLFEMLSDTVRGVLAQCTYQAIVTTDPHTYNTLRNEYGGNGHSPAPVLHHTELLDRLIQSGRLRLGHQLDRVVTYHDPCYLGRYNGVYAAPRRVIEATGCTLVEMPRRLDRALCCGAGGGRIWMAEGEVTERPSESRVREAAGLPGVTALVVSCPKDVTMYQDAVKTTGHENNLVVRDVVELVHEAL